MGFEDKILRHMLEFGLSDIAGLDFTAIHGVQREFYGILRICLLGRLHLRESREEECMRAFISISFVSHSASALFHSPPKWI
jgi:hypothetical protein